MVRSQVRSALWECTHPRDAVAVSRSCHGVLAPSKPRMKTYCFISNHAEETTMDRKHVKGAPEKVKRAVNDTAGKVTLDRAAVKFDKAQGSSHNDVADMRDVA